MINPCFLLITLLFSSSAETQQDLVVEIQGIKEAKGEIAVLLFEKKDGFPSDNKKAIRQQIVPAKKGSLTVRFGQLASGTYAVSVMHDENSNLKLDTSFMGIPKEGYGFSGNKTGLMGPPSFEDASLLLESEGKNIIIRMRY